MKIFIFFISAISITFAQNNGRVTYKSFFSETEATEELKANNRMLYQEKIDEEMMAKLLRFSLDFNKDESIFYLSESMISDAEDVSTKKYVTSLFYGYDKIYINKKENLLVEELHYNFGTILKKREANFINWELKNESKIINGYLCYKATYTYIQKWKGREFPWKIVAWYCPEIPFNYGPIRYSGLPGMILELSEKNKGYIVEKIEFFNNPLSIQVPNEGEEFTDEEIKKRQSIIRETN
jgi:GLPGLI family protein